jgi:hypothetical protein
MFFIVSDGIGLAGIWVEGDLGAGFNGSCAQPKVWAIWRNEVLSG